MGLTTYNAAYERKTEACDGCMYLVEHIVSYAAYGGKTRTRHIRSCGIHGWSIGPDDEGCGWKERRDGLAD